ncbi:WhiB family transcriptional regulator [Nocardia brasiliensis]|uniref:WhiB family transcriptional regulator n=1 Tax=Nocardia brasiliensis TaxID=37326 RepID=UPI003D76F94A
MFKSHALPPPRSDVWHWQMLAACRGKAIAVFFHPEGERGQARRARTLRAKQICQDCPVLVPCRTHALTVGEPFGIWGGMSAGERRRAIRGAASPSRAQS